MSAGPNAKPMGKGGWTNGHGLPVADEDLPTFLCDCGNRGIAHELLVDEDDSNMYCPLCGTMAWIWD